MKIRWESGADSLLLLPWSKSKYTKSSRCFRFRPICSHKWWAKKWLLMSHDTLGQMARELLLSKKLFPAWFPPQENAFPWFWFSVRSGSHNIYRLKHLELKNKGQKKLLWTLQFNKKVYLIHILYSILVGTAYTEVKSESFSPVSGQ